MRTVAFFPSRAELDRFWPRLCSRRQQRDEALNEIRVAFFLEQSGYSVVHWELTDAPPYNVEFAVALGHARNALVEVKSPGWEAEVSMYELREGRAKHDQYIDIEGRVADPVEVIRRTVTKALPKFTGTSQSMIVISDDCFANIGAWGWGPLAMALTHRSLGYGPGLFHDPAYAKIGGVDLFWLTRVNESVIHYGSLCITNPNALPSAALPEEMVARTRTVSIEPVPHLIEQGTALRF